MEQHRRVHTLEMLVLEMLGQTCNPQELEELALELLLVAARKKIEHEAPTVRKPISTEVRFNALKFRSLRERKRLTQERVGEKTGVPRSTISKLERGHRQPRFSTLERLAAVVGVEPEELML